MKELDRVRKIEKAISKDIEKKQQEADKSVESYKTGMAGLVEEKKTKARAEVQKNIDKSSKDGEIQAAKLLADAQIEKKLIITQSNKNFTAATNVVFEKLQ